jgi:uncharacterized lipoprotein YmbA
VTTLSRRFGVAALSLLAGACTLLCPPADPPRYYLLTARDVGVAERTVGVVPAPPRALVVAPVRVVAYLDRDELVTRLSAEEVRYSDESRWAEPLGPGITRVLVLDLARLVGPTRVASYRAAGHTGAAYRLTVEVSRFDVSAAGEAVLAAHWTVEQIATSNVVTTRDTRLTRRAQGDGVEAAVAALSATLDALSQEIARVLLDLHGAS